MEVGSSSLAVSGCTSSNDSLHGLKFGQKIYFEDAGNGAGGSSSMASIAAAPNLSARKGRSQGAAHPPRCQVEGCMVDLSLAKAYYSRHKVCGMHSKSPKVIVAGLEQRFCQQCSRFHQLPEFDHGKRSCRRKLAGHNERRRKPPAAPLLSRKGHISSFLHGDNSKPSCSDLNLGCPKFIGASIKGVWPGISCGSSGNSRPAIDHQWQGDFSSNHVSMAPWSPGRALFSSWGEVLQGEEYFTGVSESSCALSLLSPQTWGTTFPARTQAASCFNRPQIPPTTILNSYMNANSWGIKDHYDSESGGSSSSRSHPVRNVMELDRSEFSRELEQFLFQGGTHNMELDHSRRYGNSHDGIHWSL